MIKNNKWKQNKIKLIIWLNIILLCAKTYRIQLLIINKPKVSIFLPIFNKEFFVKASINSIQSQTLRDIEIIAVNDCSTDNTLKILKKLAKSDKRIKIVNNDRNHGLLYSRAMGLINSTGEFVLNLDPDDRFTGENILKYLYNKSKTNKLDCIQFMLQRFDIKDIQSLNENLKKLKFNNYNSNKEQIDILITNKFTKKDIYIKAYNYFITNIYGNKWNYHEDHIWHFLINKYSNSKLSIYKYMYLYLINGQSLMNNRNNNLEIKNLIYHFEMTQKISDEKNILQLISLLKNINNNSFVDNEIRNKIYHIFVNFINYYK